MNLSRILKRYPLEVGGAAIALIALAFSIPSMMDNFAAMGNISRQVQQASHEQQRLQAQQEALKAREVIAKERFKSGLFIRAKGKNTLIAVAPGIKVIDTETGLPLAPGTVVLSIDGNTGVMSDDGSVGDVAFTGDRQVINEAIQRSGINLVPGSRDYSSSNRTYK